MATVPKGSEEYERVLKAYRGFTKDPAVAGEVLHRLYKSDPGEWTARNTSARMNMSPDELAAFIPWQTADQPISSLINPVGESWKSPWRAKRP